MSNRKTIRPIPEPTLRRGSQTWEIRLRVPDEARGGRFKGTHTSRSLKTRDKAEAYEFLPAVWKALQNEFAAEALRLTRGKSRDAVPTAPTGVPAPAPNALAVLTTDDICRMYRNEIVQCAWVSRIEHMQVAKSRPVGEQTGKFDPAKLTAIYDEKLRLALESGRARISVCDFSNEETFLTFLEKSGKGIVEDHQGACIALAMTALQAHSALRDDFISTRLGAPEASDAAPSSISAPPTPLNAPVLSVYLMTYLSRKKPSAERAQGLQAVVRDFIDLVGDRRVDDYSQPHGASFVGLLLTLPANWQKSRELRHLSLSAATARAEELNLPCQSPKTIRKKVAQLSALFRAAAGSYPGVQITFPVDEVPSAGPSNEDKDPFTVSELQRLFDSELDPDLRWISLISLFSGARSNEVAQLSRARIRQHGSLYYMSFSADMRLKNGRACLRTVPIHSQLLQLGFIDLIESKSNDLFPGLTQHSSGRYSDALGKRFTYQLRRIGIKRPKLSFHSLRHTFEARLKVTAPRDAEARERIAGHALKGEASRYGSSYTAEAADMEWLAVKAGVIETLQWPGLSLENRAVLRVEALNA